MNNVLVMPCLFFFVSFAASFLTESVPCHPVPGTPPNAPFGTAIGIKPGRVAWSFAPKSTYWDGNATESGGWWNYIDSALVNEMVRDVLLSVAGDVTDLKEAWDALFRFHNLNHRRGSSSDQKSLRGYVAGEKISIKINLNGDYTSYVDNFGNQVSPQFLAALVRSLVQDADVNESDITIFDPSRLMTHYYLFPPTGLLKEFPNLGFVDGVGDVGPTQKSAPAPDIHEAHVYFSNRKVVGWNQCRVPVTNFEASYNIVVDDFRGHAQAGFTASGKNYFGCVYFPNATCSFGQHTILNTHFCPTPLHPWIYMNDVPMASYAPQVDLLGHPKLGGNALLWVVGGLYGAPSNVRLDKHQQPHPVQPCSVFASLDPIALDSVLFDILRNEPNVPFAHHGCVDNYLHEGAKAENPPSGVRYFPDGQHTLESLGVHEHWNDASQKQYSRNLGFSKGIELVRIRH